MQTEEEKKARNAAYYAANAEKYKAHRVANKEKVRAYQKVWYAANTEKVRAQRAAFYAGNAERLKVGKRARYSANPEKGRAQTAAYRAANPEKVKAQKKSYQIRNPEKGRVRSRIARYGLTDDKFQDLLLKQKNSCAICSFIFSSGEGRTRAASIDHDHATGRIRGILCAACNHGLGKFKDSSTILRAAAEYLEKIQ